MLYVNLTALLFLLRFGLAGRARLRGQLYYVILIALFLFSAFRYRVGCDWPGYFIQYSSAADFDWSTLTTIREPIWWAILAWIASNNLPYPIANVVTSLIFFAGIHVLARRQPDPLAFLVLLFPVLIINMPMSGIRQAAAIGLLCMAFVAFIDRRPVQFAAWVAIATGFHASSFVVMLLLPLAGGRYTRMRLLISALIALPGAVFLTSSEAAELAVSRYVGSGNDAAGAAFRIALLGLTSLYFFLFLRRKWQHAFPQDYSMASVGVIGVSLAVLILPLSTVIADRLGYFLVPIQTVIFARLPFLNFRLNPALHSALPYLGLLLVFTVWAQYSKHFQLCYMPYQTWIFGFPGSDLLGY